MAPGCSHEGGDILTSLSYPPGRTSEGTKENLMKPAQIAEFTNVDDGIKTVVYKGNAYFVRLLDLDSGQWLGITEIFSLNKKDAALTYAKNVAAGVPTS